MPDLFKAVGNYFSAKEKASASKAASKAQQESFNRAIDEQQRQFDALREILAPYVSAGRPDLTQPYIGAGPGAVQQMQRLAGLGGEQARQQAIIDIRQSPQFTQLSDITKEKIDEYNRTRDQLRKSVKGENNLAAFDLATNAGIRDIQSQGYAQQQALLQPVLQDKQYEQMGMEQQRQAIQQIEQGPLFQELARQGEAALLANASATGRRGAEDTQSALARYRPQLLNSLIEQQYGKLAGLTSLGSSSAQNLLQIGQASAAGTGSAGLQTAQNIGGYLTNQGAAKAAGIIGSGTANAEMYQNFGNMPSEWNKQALQAAALMG